MERAMFHFFRAVFFSTDYNYFVIGAIIRLIVLADAIICDPLYSDRVGAA